MSIEFKVDSEIKQEYLNTKPSKTAESDAFVLREFDDYEEKVGKPVYNLNLNELNEMFANLRNTSKRGAGKNKSILTNYIDFCVSKKIVAHMENRARYIDYEKFVARQALLNKFISKEKMMEYQKLLYNEQDQLLIWLLYIGVRGRTTEDGTMEEIINFTIDDVKADKNMLILRQNDGEARELHDVPDFIIDLIKDAYEEEFYIENNGEMTTNDRLGNQPRKVPINKDGEYSKHVFRTPGKKKFANFSNSLLNSRMRKIQDVCDNRYVTWTVLFTSGQLQMCFDILKEKGEITDKDFDNVCVQFNYGIDKSKELKEDKKQSSYWFVLKDLFLQYQEVMNK